MLNHPGFNDHRAHIEIVRHLDAVDVPVPDDIRYACDVDAALAAVARPDPASDLRAAVARRDTPAKVAAGIGKAAAALAAADKVEQARVELSGDLDRIARRALHDHGDEIIAEMRPTFDAALGAAHAAIEVLGPDAPSSDLLSRPKLRAMWHDVEEARRRLDAVLVVVTDLADCGYRPNSDHRLAMYVARPDDLETIPHKLWAAITQGYTVQLNTVAEANQITAARDRAVADLAARREERKQRDRRESPMARAFRRADELAREAAATGGPQDAA